MTTQISDDVDFQGKRFTLCDHNGDGLFEPAAHGLAPAMPSTACYRGWMAVFSVEEHLRLQNLYLFHKAGPGSPSGIAINAILPIGLDWPGDFNYLYPNLNLPVPFTGELIIGRDFVTQHRFCMDFNDFRAYETVVELIFEDGSLKNVEDKSHVALALRQNYLRS